MQGLVSHLDACAAEFMEMMGGAGCLFQVGVGDRDSHLCGMT